MPPCEGSDVGCNKIPAERGNDMQLDRCFRFPTRSRAGQRFHFILVDLYFARLLHLLAQINHKQLEKAPAPCPAGGNRESGRAWRRVGLGWDCTSVTAITTPLAPLLIGPLMSPGLMLKATAACPVIDPIFGNLSIG